MHPRGTPIGGQVARMTDPRRVPLTHGENAVNARDFPTHRKYLGAKSARWPRPWVTNLTSAHRNSTFYGSVLWSPEPRPSVTVVAPPQRLALESWGRVGHCTLGEASPPPSRPTRAWQLGRSEKSGVGKAGPSVNSGQRAHRWPSAVFLPLFVKLPSSPLLVCVQSACGN
jgi:hypothetical protein